MNDFEAARNAWEAALHLNPRGPGAHDNLAFALGENDRAIAWLHKALDLNLENLDMYSFLAMAYANIGNAAKSATLSRSIEGGP